MNKIFEKGKIFFIAEMSANHQNDFQKAKKIIKAVSKTGANAIKFQTFLPEEMTLNIKDKKFQINEKTSLWRGKRLYDLYKESSMRWDWQTKLFSYARKCGLLPFSSPFGEDSLNFLIKLNTKIFKVASLENSHFPLLQLLSKTKKPIILSTGSASEKEISDSINFLKKKGCKNLTLLKCTSVYPAPPSELNLLGIPYLKNKFRCRVGFSDHSKGISSALTAVALGAEVIEKHIKLNENDKSLDSEFSITVKELKKLIEKSREIKESMGKKFFLTKSEKHANSRRRSIIAIKNIKKNEIFTKNNIAVLRPNIGLHPKYYSSIIGKKAKFFIKLGSPIKWNFKN
tara:strand:- start:777 stop:1805 length:1029 start_codon:yes stop_codon:yes gene_type:complete